ncbi:TVP38/TMEM64 family protein [Marinobacter persicus]|uniref:TVP38/TMEM64 family membrane protein n=1 Tax=Marinobacter persicus TaxID=930118 RepID=A0A2S6GA18_9GAMM|nr:TVP38/TMEM64 family protein [Marinobacter persicus]PPK53329.1 putative membrane protein YdjX (TVP38/TMEM64 family) [Marinobacter persicus]PPK56166.1 putative membrane protein YdjX (TVP38/TMEM64 family) [Marinobacter persicus]PPK59761.1 putative membrane protein YdjX (TVP38/TMEM64 family) [Marinobacter persicus]
MIFRASIMAIVILALAAAWWLLQALGMPASLTSQTLTDWLNQEGAAGPALLMLLMVIAVIVGPIPTLPISATAGLAFGLIKGTLIAATGALLGALLAFWIARLLGRDAILRHFPDNPILAEGGSQRFLTIAILLTRAIPIFSFALISYAAGVTAIHTWRFALATFFGMLPMTMVFAGLGTTFELNPVLTVVAGLAILAVMAWLPWSISRHPESRLARWLHLRQ